MTACLPPNLLALFAPREPIPYLPPVDKTLAEKKRAGYLGVGAFLSYFEHPKDILAPVRVESRDERKERKKRERQEMMTYKLEQELARWNPADNNEASTDPYKTIFVGRLSYETSESKIKREFEQYGPVVSVKMVHDKNTGKPKGYAFVEFENENDMHAAYKHGDGKKIDGRRITVDVERGRTVKGWKPRRLGGGRGGRKTGATDPDKPNVRPGDDRAPGGGPMRGDRDRGDRDRYRDAGRPYGDRPPIGRGGYGGDRNGGGGYGGGGGGGYQDRNNAGFFESQRNNGGGGGYQDRGGQFGSRDFGGGDRGRQDLNRGPPMDRGPMRDDRNRDRGDDRNRDRDRGGRDERGGGRDRSDRDRSEGGDRDRRRR
ncbi:U1 small nuclear ribonucleoprotein 70 kDa [Hypsibius exemplaris]|uniref:U1 small nuclear ribonucleoprotein 70 kDa n=1 Tax=Hypsibius exemplaris TaxID=2072580 RepID=A0A1W0WRP6_HYPEX|nr:U1 small nuclear ribonucleoprotein 70 kDa [Hypsibius exemplaris]